MDPGEDSAALRTCVKKLPLNLSTLEGKIVAAGFIRDAERFAGGAPFRAMGRDPAAPGEMLGEKMREFMAKRPLDLIRRDLDQLRIQNDPAFLPVGQPGGGAERGIPTNRHRERAATGGEKKLVGEVLKQRIRAQAGPAARGLMSLR